MVQKYLSKRGGRFYCLFVDFTQAFGTVDHYKLLTSLNKKIIVKSNRLSQNIVSNTLVVALYGCHRHQYVILKDELDLDELSSKMMLRFSFLLL